MKDGCRTQHHRPGAEESHPPTFLITGVQTWVPAVDLAVAGDRPQPLSAVAGAPENTAPDNHPQPRAPLRKRGSPVEKRRHNAAGRKPESGCAAEERILTSVTPALRKHSSVSGEPFLASDFLYVGKQVCERALGLPVCVRSSQRGPCPSRPCPERRAVSCTATERWVAGRTAKQ